MLVETHPKTTPKATDRFLDRQVFPFWPGFTVEKLLITLIILLTVISRFYDVGARVMSHDEINHVVPSYSISTYVYDPVTHGPFQFHAIALSYFLFGASDFSSRIPAALFGVAVIVFTLFAWKRYLGRIGALIGGVLFLISPYILFYSRYSRNEIFIVFWGMVMLWLFLRYLEDGKQKWLLWLALIVGMHYADKATAYIFTAEALIFLALLFIRECARAEWPSEKVRVNFLSVFLIAMLCLVLVGGFYMLHKSLSPVAPLVESVPSAGGGIAQPASSNIFAGRIPMLAAVLLFTASVIWLIVLIIKGLGWKRIRASRVFDLLVFQLLLVLPLLTALPVQMLGYSAQDTSTAGILRTGVVFVLLFAIALFLGLMWNRKTWLLGLAIFWSIFVLFYTTFFTHGEGFFKGIVSALAYWMEQQGEQRGSQPLYYYAFVQIPFYEFLPAIGAVTTFIIALKHKLFFSLTGQPFKSSISETKIIAPDSPAEIDLAAGGSAAPEVIEPSHEAGLADPAAVESPQSELVKEESNPENETVQPQHTWFHRFFTLPENDPLPSKALPVVLLLLYWGLISLLAFSIAGERMPWLTTHITMPLILSSAWGLAYLVEKIDWESVYHKRGWLVALVSIVLIVSFSSLIGSLLGNNPPLLGKTLAELQATSTFLMALLGAVASAIGLAYLLRGWLSVQYLRFLALLVFAFMGVFTARSAFRAAYVNYDNAKELLVYAHSTRDMKDVLEQVETISKRLYGDLSIPVAYDNESLYPFWWYFRDYPNKKYVDQTFTRDLRESPVILVGAQNYSKVEPVVREGFYVYNYMRMWWPNEFYQRQTLKTVWEAFKNPEIRAGLWQLWFNRDYTQFARATNNPSLTLATWSPANQLRMYIRKDIAAQIWEYGLTPQPEAPRVDPYQNQTMSLDPVKVINIAGETTFNAPRGLALAADGSIFVADSRNHRVVHLDSSGLFINAWGGYANVLDGSAPQGLFNEPWGVAVGPDGNVYVTDTWNQRVQVFTPEGQFLRMWDTFLVDGVADSFWGPRGIVIDPSGKVFVTDTGKQRVVIFDNQGNYLGQFGGRGIEQGQLDEPVGIALDAQGKVYIADTWNTRIQIFAPQPDGTYTSETCWEIDAWQSNSLDDKPFIALSSADDVFFTDPDRGYVLQFKRNGEFVQRWGGFDNSYMMGIINGIVVTADGKVWVTDATSNALLQFDPSATVATEPASQPADTTD